MNVKDLRAKCGLTQQELSTETGIPRSRIAKWEEGKGNPKADDFTTLDGFFKKRLRELVPKPVKGNQPAQLSEEAQNDNTLSSINTDENKVSLEKSIENLTQNELRTTAIIERLVALLEKKNTEPMKLPEPGSEASSRIKRRETAKK
jgi:transcriptional regulator with XRE-family HTH domain